MICLFLIFYTISKDIQIVAKKRIADRKKTKNSHYEIKLNIPCIKSIWNLIHFAIFAII